MQFQILAAADKGTDTDSMPSLEQPKASQAPVSLLQ